MGSSSLPIVGIAITLVIVGIYVYDPSIYNGLSISLYFLNLAKSADPLMVYVVVFIVTLIGNASIFIVIPYPLAILYAIESNINIAILIVVASLAAAAGELLSYALGVLGRRITESHIALYNKLGNVLRKNRKKVYLAIFIAAMTPLPDDLILIPLGLARFGLMRSFAPCFLGKLVLIIILVEFSELFMGSFRNTFFLDLLTLWFIIGMMYVAMKSNEEIVVKQIEKIIE